MAKKLSSTLAEGPTVVPTTTGRAIPANLPLNLDPSCNLCLSSSLDREKITMPNMQQYLPREGGMVMTPPPGFLGKSFEFEPPHLPPMSSTGFLTPDQFLPASYFPFVDPSTSTVFPPNLNMANVLPPTSFDVLSGSLPTVFRQNSQQFMPPICQVTSDSCPPVSSTIHSDPEPDTVLVNPPYYQISKTDTSPSKEVSKSDTKEVSKTDAPPSKQMAAKKNDSVSSYGDESADDDNSADGYVTLTPHAWCLPINTSLPFVVPATNLVPVLID